MRTPQALLLLLALLLHAPTAYAAEQHIDVTNRFTGLWNQSEQLTVNDDGTLTYMAKRWGGLSCWIGGNSWAQYDRLVFVFAESTPCDVQPIILFQDGGDAVSHYTEAGVMMTDVELPADRRHAIAQVALQTAADATIHISRIYLVLTTDDNTQGDNDDSYEANEEQDARLMLNELMQGNVDCVMDDLNDFPDSWVELYNGGTTAARLNRYRIGISPNIDEAWTLPAKKVKAGKRILVCCDKEGKGLHTNFRLESGKGCQLYLFRDGQLIDHVEGLQKQPAPNISYGRSTDGANEWGYQLSPTPAKANEGGICDHDHLLGEPLFSTPGHITSQTHLVQLELAVPEGSPAGTQIRYTLDGSEPTQQSTLYTRPLQFRGNSVVRARLFCQGWLSPPSTTHSYLVLGRELTLPVVSIATNGQYLNGSSTGIFVNNNGDKRVNWRRPINIEFFMDGEGTPSTLNQLCETRVAGAASRGAAKKSMAIYAHKRFGTKRFEHEFFPDQKPGLTDFKSLVLRNAGNDFDYLYLRDALVQRTMALHADLDWQAWQPVIVFINGRYHGMLNLRERANEDNIYTNYNHLEDIDLIENWNDLKEGTWDAYNEFKAFYQQKGHTMAEYEEWMDCGEFINLMAMNLYFNNFDFPGNNIIMWRPRTPATDDAPHGGRWRWVAKDCDYTLWLYDQGPATYNIIEWLYNPNYDGNHNWGANGTIPTRLFRQLMDDGDFRREFVDRCAIYMGDFLNEQGIRAIWDPMYDIIKTEYPYHRELINKWWPNYYDEQGRVQWWVSQRTEQFYDQLANRYGLGTPIPLNVTWTKSSDDDVAISFNGINLSQGTFDGKFFLGHNIVLRAQAGEHKQVTGWQLRQMDANGGQKTQQVEGPTLSMTMPACSRLIINPILATADDIATLQQPSWTWRRSARAITVEHAEPGVRVSLCDLRGIVVAEATTTVAGPIVLPAQEGKAYVLRVGADAVKIGGRPL